MKTTNSKVEESQIKFKDGGNPKVGRWLTLMHVQSCVF